MTTEGKPGDINKQPKLTDIGFAEDREHIYPLTNSETRHIRKSEIDEVVEGTDVPPEAAKVIDEKFKEGIVRMRTRTSRHRPSDN
ncbi:hypothetical protein A3J13_00365 [Candidatus Daviesbacteria bacterium RIFCSPLOWO2_02_FULL_36_8]|uniref:Uncharacterized protein n=1 Tax=Candidatus Daviesbacteria bacterium RIFCSPLOWO2_02_FULL_36_8 TaxID=1797793 RepID=A0A1F5MGK0_9BACT|nr:MAG: hypothetical protein A3J13_00365 [Candidatus Daviesbacteria bacterium RIFCSPLOWO2_02_FULL_36_8]